MRSGLEGSGPGDVDEDRGGDAGPSGGSGGKPPGTAEVSGQTGGSLRRESSREGHVFAGARGLCDSGL